MSLSGWMKLIAIVALLGAIAYSYAWTYQKGHTVGEAECKVAGAKMLADALKQNEDKMRLERQLEMNEAADLAASRLKREQIKAKGLQQLNEQLKLTKCAGELVPDSVVELLSPPGPTSPSK